MSIGNIELSNEQKQALDIIRRTDGDFRLGGYAGTGKTTLIRAMTAIYKNCAVCAFAGKAADVLRRKGIQATTIHRLIYDPFSYKDEVEFVLKPDIDADIIIVDEASMIGDLLYNDLMSFGKRIVWVGDPAQLEPIGRDTINLMANPNFVLQKVHRQAEESGILLLATQVRNGGDVHGGFADVQYGGDPHEAEQILCATNRTRIRLNAEARERRGFGEKLCIGDRLVCLQNNAEFEVFNGQIATVCSIIHESESSAAVRLVGESGDHFSVKMTKAFLGESPDRLPHLRGYTIWDYGYALTAHKAQGSEWDSVCVIDEPWPKLDARRWRYTAITRAAKQLTWNEKKASADVLAGLKAQIAC